MVNEKQKINLVSDTTFKYLLKKEQTKQWLYEIIESVCKIDLTDFKLTDNESNTGRKIKDYRMDTVLENNNLVIIIEMNNGNRTTSTIKGYQYLYRVESSYLFKGASYVKKLTKLIMFNNYYNETLPSIPLSHYELIDKENHLVIDDIESFEIYLPFFHKLEYDKCSQIEKRLYLFGCQTIEEMKQVVTNPEDENQMIIKELEGLSMDGMYLTELEYETMQSNLKKISEKESFDSGVEVGYDNGFDNGKQARDIEIVKELAKRNMPIEDISSITKLSIEEVNNILKEN
jgi:predicted transposase/invertase (TIGR01784 family)